jgi:hypothetical protein
VSLLTPNPVPIKPINPREKENLRFPLDFTYHGCPRNFFYDGSGYPGGLEGEGIPIQARIIAIADAFDALTTNRPYRKGIDIADALEELIEKGGSQFDPFLVEIFCKTMRE